MPEALGKRVLCMAFSAIDSCDWNYIPRPWHWPRKTRAEMVFCSRRLKKEEPHPGLQHCFGGKLVRGGPLRLIASVPPHPAAPAALSACAPTSLDNSPPTCPLFHPP